jgi:hypothetical protein
LRSSGSSPERCRDFGCGIFTPDLLLISSDDFRGKKAQDNIRRPEAGCGALTDGRTVDAKDVGEGKRLLTRIRFFWFVLGRF